MWQVIEQKQIDRFLKNGSDFIDDAKIETLIKENSRTDRIRVRDIVQKALSLERLEPEEVATLLNVEDKELLEEIFFAAGEVKRRVYDNRIVTFAPLYLSNFCVNSCLYCGFRSENKEEKRKRLSLDEVIKETEVLVKTGHKRQEEV